METTEVVFPDDRPDGAAPDDGQVRDVPSHGPTPPVVEGRSWTSLACIGVGLVVAFGAIKLARPAGGKFTMEGDAAFIELAVRQALRHGTALGVYSRFGWHHLGPAYLYLLAPAYWLSGDGARSFFLSAWLINGASALASVLIVRRYAGERAARVLVAGLFVFGLSGIAHFIDPWNPKVLALPLLLLMTSVAAAYVGSLWSGVLALVVASYLVQAHLGTLPISATLLILAAFGLSRSRTSASRRVPLIVGAALLSLMWVGPIVQEVSHSNGNITQIARFYRHPPAGEQRGHSLGASLVVVSNHATVIPFGQPRDIHGHLGRFAAAGAFAALGLVAAFLARRRAPFVAALALTTTIGLAIAVVAASRVIGPLDGFLFYWTEVLPLPAIVAAGWLALDRARSGAANTAVDAVSAIVVVVCLAFSFRAVAIARPATIGDAALARTVAARIEQDVGSRNQRFSFRVDSPRVDPGSIALELDKAGYHFRLDPMVDLYRGNLGGTVNGPFYVVRETSQPAPAGAHDRLIATVGRLNLLVES